jgi:hypothetical protein
MSLKMTPFFASQAPFGKACGVAQAFFSVSNLVRFWR